MGGRLRFVALHARGRRAGPVAAGLGGVAVGCWALARLTDSRLLVPVLGPLAAVSLLGFALGGADPALERVTPRPWLRWRVAELGVCALAAGLALLPALTEHATEALRNLAGLGGLTALGAVLLGPRLAWLAPAAYAFSGAAAGPDRLVLLTWPVQPDATGLAFAAGLAVAGAALHARYGAATDAPAL